MIMVMVRRVTLEDEQIHGGGPRVYRHVRFHQYSSLSFHMRKNVSWHTQAQWHKMSNLNPSRHAKSSSKTRANVSFRWFSHEKKNINNNNNSNIFSSYTHGCFIAHVNLVKKQGCIYLSKVIIFILQQYNQHWLLDFLSFSGLISSLWPLQWVDLYSLRSSDDVVKLSGLLVSPYGD